MTSEDCSAAAKAMDHEAQVDLRVRIWFVRSSMKHTLEHSERTDGMGLDDASTRTEVCIMGSGCLT